MTERNPTVEYVLESHPFARYRIHGDWSDGVRPAHIVETIQDVLWALGHADADAPSLACGFCGGRYTHKASTPDAALRWFRTHACDGEGETWTPT